MIIFAVFVATSHASAQDVKNNAGTSNTADSSSSFDLITQADLEKESLPAPAVDWFAPGAKKAPPQKEGESLELTAIKTIETDGSVATSQPAQHTEPQPLPEQPEQQEQPRIDEILVEQSEPQQPPVQPTPVPTPEQPAEQPIETATTPETPTTEPQAPSSSPTSPSEQTEPQEQAQEEVAQQPAPEPEPEPAPQPAPQWSPPPEQQAPEAEKEKRPPGIAALTSIAVNRFNLQSFTGSVTYDHQSVTKDGNLSGRVFLHDYSLAYQNQLAETKSFNLNIMQNLNDMMVKTNETANTTLNYTTKKYNLTATRANNESSQMSSAGDFSSNNNVVDTISLSFNAIKKMPLTLNIQKNTTDTVQSGGAPQKNITDTLNFSAAPAFLGKLKTNISYNSTTAKDQTSSNRTENDVTLVTFEYPVSERLVLHSQTQRTTNSYIPLNPDQKSENTKMQHKYGLDFHLSPELIFSTNYNFEHEDIISAQQNDRKKLRDYEHTLTYNKSIYSLSLGYKTTDAQVGADSRDWTLNLGLNPNSEIFKNANMAMTNKRTYGADSAPQNENSNINMNYNFSLAKKLTLSTQYTVTRNETFPSQTSPTNISVNRTKLFRLDNPLTKSITQSLSWQRNAASSLTAKTSETNTYTHTIQKAWTSKLFGKEMSLNASRNHVLTASEPAGQENTNKSYTASLAAPLSGMFDLNYRFTYNTNIIEGVTPGGNFTRQNEMSLNFKGKNNAVGNLVLNISGSKDGTQTRNIVLNMDFPMNDMTSWFLSLNRNKTNEKRESTFYSGVTHRF